MAARMSNEADVYPLRLPRELDRRLLHMAKQEKRPLSRVIADLLEAQLDVVNGPERVLG